MTDKFKNETLKKLKKKYALTNHLPLNEYLNILQL